MNVMTPLFKTVPATEHERMILQYIYDENLQDRMVNMREALTRHAKRLPAGFDVSKMDHRLLWLAGPRVQMQGLIVLLGEQYVLNRCHPIIGHLKEMVLSDHKVTSIDMHLLPDKLNMSLPEISIYLEALRPYSDMFMSITGQADSTCVVKVDLTYSENIFNEYFRYTTMEDLVARHRAKLEAARQEDITGFESDDLDTQLERQAQFAEVSAKLDELVRLHKGSEEAREALAQEVRELKEMYFKVNRKNFIQFLGAKLPEIALAKLFENDTLKFAYNSAMVGIHFLQNHH